jgi:hypothetical protein
VQSTNASVLIQPPSGRNGDDFLLAAKVSSQEQLLAVSGALVAKEAIQSVWNKVVGAFNISDSAQLYWLDEGGYVIATNQINAAVGSFIGHSDPQVGIDFLNNCIIRCTATSIIEHSVNL